MKNGFLILFSMLLFSASITNALAAEEDYGRHRNNDCCKSAGEGQCPPEKRGWCGKRKGDWYGVRRPVSSVNDARELFVKYFSDQKLVVGEVSEKPWRFEADLLDAGGTFVDRVMIDKRSGRIRSIY